MIQQFKKSKQKLQIKPPYSSQTTSHSPSTTSHFPCPQSIVPGSQLIVQKTPSQLGASSPQTQEAAWQQLAGTHFLSAKSVSSESIKKNNPAIAKIITITIKKSAFLFIRNKAIPRLKSLPTFKNNNTLIKTRW